MNQLCRKWIRSIRSSTTGAGPLPVIGIEGLDESIESFPRNDLLHCGEKLFPTCGLLVSSKVEAFARVLWRFIALSSLVWSVLEASATTLFYNIESLFTGGFFRDSLTCKKSPCKSIEYLLSARCILRDNTSSSQALIRASSQNS